MLSVETQASGQLEAGVLTVTTVVASLLPITGGVTVTEWYRAHRGHKNQSNDNKPRSTLWEMEALSLESGQMMACRFDTG